MKFFEGPVYLSLSKGWVVKVKSTKREWVYVEGVNNPEINDAYKGWIPKNSLREKKIDEKGFNIYTEEDFYFDEETLPYKYKDIVVKAINYLHRNDPQCRVLEPGSTAIARSKETAPGDVTFYVTCGEGDSVFNTFFTKNEIESEKQIRAPIILHLSQRAIKDLIKAEIMNRMSDGEKLTMNSGWDYIKETPNGRTRVKITYELSNLFQSVEFAYFGLFDQNGKIESSVELSEDNRNSRRSSRGR